VLKHDSSIDIESNFNRCSLFGGIFMRRPNSFALLLIEVFAIAGLIGSMAWSQTKQLESPQMGVIVNVPDGWKTATGEAHPTAVWGNGAAKIVLLYFEKQYLFEVMNSAKVAANFAPALDNAKIIKDDQVALKTLIGATRAAQERCAANPCSSIA
jgi:hypothetical protein